MASPALYAAGNGTGAPTAVESISLSEEEMASIR